MYYNKNTWANGDLITKEKLNNMENGIYEANNNIPTKLSQLTNDTSYATEAYVRTKISEASTGNVDLSNYVTKTTGNANQITFADGQSFQAKLDAGTLKGAKGDKGDKGDRGEQGPQGIQGPKGDPGSGGGSSINDTTASTTSTYSSNKIETIIGQKANQSDLEVQKQRIDGFTTLASGSTTGDAELIDGRIGADGVTYSNIGTAIRTQCGNLNNLLDVYYEVTSNNRIDDSKFVGQNFDTLIGHNGNSSKTFTLGARLKSRSIKGFIEFEDGTSPDLNAGFFWYLKSSTGEAQDLTISSTGTLVVSDNYDKYDQVGIGSHATYNKNIKTFFIGAYDADYDNYRAGLTSKVLDNIKISTPDNWYGGKKICAYGDSVVEQEKWQPYVASYFKCSFYNRGVGGTTVTQVNSSTNHMSGDTRVNTIPTDSDVILIFAGHNDWSYAAINMGNLKTDALSESTSFKSAFALMIKKIQARCPNARLITMTPVGGRTEDAATNQDKQFYVRDLCMTDFANAVKEVSAYYGIPCIDVNANCGINTLNHTTYVADVIHPNEAGGKLIANEVINGMKRFQPIDL